MAIKYNGNKYNGGGGPSYMKGYTGKGGRNGRKKNNFVPVIIVIVLIIIAIFAYCSIGSDDNELNDGNNVVATSAPTSKPTSEPTAEPTEEDVISTPSPTLSADDTVDSYKNKNVPTAAPKSTSKPKATDKPKPTAAPTAAPVVATAVPTEIPSNPNGSAYINKYYDSGIYVRSGASTENSVVLHILRNDHTTRLIPTGNTQVDAEGYTWLEVTIPSGANGWVRSDVVAKQ